MLFDNYILKNNKKNDEHSIRNKFTILSFICSIFVIYIHTYNLETYGIAGESDGFEKFVYFVENYFHKVNQIAVPMFFIISGLLFFRTFEINRLFEKWKSRFKTIFIPYIIWCSIYYVFFAIITNFSLTKSIINHENVPLSFLEWINWLWPNEYYTLWFLKNLIVYIIATPFIWILLKERKKVPVSIYLLCFIILLKTRFPLGGYFNGIEYYLVGSYIGINGRNLLQYKNKIISVISCIYVLICIGTQFKYGGVVNIIFFCLSLWFVLDFFSLNIKLPWWMSITFFTYVAHDIFLESFEKVLFKLGGGKAYFALIDYILAPIFIEFVLIIIAYFMKKKLRIIWQILTGYR